MRRRKAWAVGNGGKANAGGAEQKGGWPFAGAGRVVIWPGGEYGLTSNSGRGDESLMISITIALF